MSVRVKIALLLRKFTDGQEFVQVAGSSPLECLHNMEVQFPGIGEWLFDKQGEVRPQLWVFVNGERIYAGELASLVKDGDELFIMLALAGG
jgi:molybdopterin converting factor small subunit